MIRPDLDQIPTYVPGARNDTAVKLSSNEACQPPLPAAQEAMADAAAQAHRYPDMGVIALREALAEHLGVTVDEVAAGNGSSALCQQLVQATTGTDNEVIFPWRSFEAYPLFTQVVGATPVPVPLTKDHRLDLPAMANAINAKTSLIFVCNPNNPTGATITTAEFEEFMSRVPADVVVGLDEAYFEYNNSEDTPVATEVIRRYDNVVGLRTFSKAYGLAGVRVGYAFGPAPLIEAMIKVAIPFGVNAVGQAGAIASLAAANELARRVDAAIAERERLVTELSDYGVPPSSANHVWLPAENLSRAGLGTPFDLAGRLAEEGVLVRAFDEGMRVTVTVAEETDAFLKAWHAVTA